ncbi:hypothetical protein EON80_26700 [bacterium]|nr:MAG: hypothetical protein EON80_26700 [bacterium]
MSNLVEIRCDQDGRGPSGKARTVTFGESLVIPFPMRGLLHFTKWLLFLGLGIVALWHQTKITTVFGSPKAPDLVTGVVEKPMTWSVEAKSIDDTSFAHAQADAIRELDRSLHDFPWTACFEVQKRHTGTHILRYDRLTRSLRYIVTELIPAQSKTFNFISPERIHEVATARGSIASFEAKH